MASIDEVIARSRQKGEFTERRRFTVARQSAIRKMRKFALADPFYYILELIQAAIANGATYIDILCQDNDPTMTFSYVGGGFAETELSQIFDFLFASKDDLDVADIRQLALGINALLLSEPTEIVIESGKGSIESTTRVVINPRQNTVDVGTPTKALDGTFVSARGMNRRKLGNRHIREGSVIESRCLTAPVPVLYNNQPLFGYRTMRSPNIFGFAKTITFDEGDLYGTLGIARTANQDVVKLLTYGVWIESVSSEFDGSYGGVVAFDRLRKSADHAGIVKDDVYRELWARLRPYVRQLAEGKTGKAVLDVGELGGPKMTAVEIRELGAEAGRLVVFDARQVASAEDEKLARGFGEVLDAPVLVADGGDKSVVQLVAHDDVQVLMPELSAQELEFYRRPESPEPEKPWLTSPVDVESLTISKLRDWLGAEGIERADGTSILAGFPLSKPVRARIYTTVEDRAPGRMHVEVRTSNRVVWQGDVVSPSPGHILVVELPDVPSARLLDEIGPQITVASLIGEVMAQHAMDAASQASSAVIGSIAFRELTPESAASRIVLAAASRALIKRIRVEADHPEVRFALVDENLPDELLDQPVLKTLDGTPRSIRDLEDLINENGGLLYGVIPEVVPDLEGLDRSQILELDQASEEALLGMVGEASYVRVDKRDVLAESKAVKVRDIALGLRAYPDFPLLIEGGAADANDVNLLGELVHQLKTLYEDHSADEELRRQAVRHLLYFLGHVRATEDSDAYFGIDSLALFRNGRGSAVSFRTIERVADERGRVPMLDGWAVDAAGLGDAEPTDYESFAESPGLAMNPFILQALAPLGWLTASFDFDSTESESHEAEAERRFLVSSVRDDNKLQGRIGIPDEAVEHPAISLIASAEKRVWPLRTAAAEFGLVGRLTTRMSVNRGDVSAIENWCMTAGYQLIDDLRRKLPDFEGPDFERATAHLLNFAARHLDFVQAPDGRVTEVIRDDAAARVLALPLFESRQRLLVSGHRVIRVFVESIHFGDAPTVDEFLADDIPEYLKRWCETNLSPDAVTVEPSSSMREVEEKELEFVAAASDQEIASWLADALDALRPDHRTNTRVLFGIPTDGRYQLENGQSIYMPDGQPFGYHESGESFSVLVVRPDHPLIEEIRQDGATLRELGWLLMGSYAYINEVLLEVTNEHELEFQTRLVSYLSDAGVIGAAR